MHCHHVSHSWIITGPHVGLAPVLAWYLGVCLVWYSMIAQGNPTLYRGVPVVSIQKSSRLSKRDWKSIKKSSIPCKFCTYRFITYSSTHHGKVRIHQLMANIRIVFRPNFFEIDCLFELIQWQTLQIPIPGTHITWCHITSFAYSNDKGVIWIRFALPTSAPYLYLTCELWGVYCRYLGWNWQRHNRTFNVLKPWIMLHIHNMN